MAFLGSSLGSVVGSRIDALKGMGLKLPSTTSDPGAGFLTNEQLQPHVATARPDAPGGLPGTVVADLSPRFPFIEGRGSLNAITLTLFVGHADLYWFHESERNDTGIGPEVHVNLEGLPAGSYLAQLRVNGVEGGEFAIRGSGQDQTVGSSGKEQVLVYFFEEAKEGGAAGVRLTASRMTWAFYGCRVTRLEDSGPTS